MKKRDHCHPSPSSSRDPSHSLRWRHKNLWERQQTNSLVLSIVRNLLPFQHLHFHSSSSSIRNLPSVRGQQYPDSVLRGFETNSSTVLVLHCCRSYDENPSRTAAETLVVVVVDAAVAADVVVACFQGSPKRWREQNGTLCQTMVKRPI